MDKRRLLVITVCSFLGAFLLQKAATQFQKARGIDARVTTPAASAPAFDRALRPDYPYSVIRGGAYSPAELRYADAHDAVVRAHYADFDIGSARLVKLTQDRYQYVSYRLKNHVYWTRHKLLIPKGETLLTDGHNYARTRCGNRLSSKPKGNTSAEQPPLRLLSLPPFKPAQPVNKEMTFAPAPPLGELAQEFPNLPLELPRLAPYLPARAAAGPFPSQTWAPVANYPPPIPIVPGYIPIPGPAAAVIPPSTPIGGPPAPPIINQVPEPASLTVFALAFFVSFCVLARMMRPRRGEDVKEDESQSPL